MIALVKRYALLAALAAIVGVGLWLYHGICPGVPALGPGMVPHAGVVLPKDDNEQILVDPRHHTITVVRLSGTTVTHLPDRQSVIDIRKDGTVKVTASQFGIECRPFIGLGYSDDARIGLGLDGLYWKALDLGGGIAVNFHGSSPRIFVALGYNVKDNLRIALTLDHAKQPGLMLSLRI